MGSFGGGFGSFSSAGQGGLSSVAGGRISTAYIELVVNNSRAIATMRQTRAQTNALAAEMDRSLSGAGKSASASWAASMDRMGRTLQDRGRSMVASGATLSRRLSLPLIAVGAAATKMALDFDTAMTQIQALGGETGLSLDKLRSSVMKLGIETAQNPTDLAHALYFVSSAGLQASQVMPVLEQAAKGAATGMGDAQTVGQLLVSTLNGYRGTGLKAANVMNILAEAIRKGNVEPAEFAKGLGMVIPQASQLGISLDQVAAATSNATNYGVEATRAFTGMRYLLGNIIKPTGAAETALKQYGFTIDEVQRNVADPNRGFLWTMREISDKMNLQTVDGRKAWATFIGGVRGAVIANTAVGRSIERTDEIFQSLRQAADDTSTSFERAYATMKARPEFAFQQAMTQLRETMIELGQILVPVLVHDILPALEGLAKGFRGLSSGTQEWIVRLGILAALLGPGKMLVGGLTWLVGGLLRGGAAILRFAGLLAAPLTETGALAAETATLTGAIEGLSGAMFGNAGASTAMAAGLGEVAGAEVLAGGTAGAGGVAQAVAPGGGLLKLTRFGSLPAAAAAPIAAEVEAGTVAGVTAGLAAPEVGVAATGLGATVAGALGTAGAAAAAGIATAIGIGLVSQIADAAGAGGTNADRYKQSGLTFNMQDAIGKALSTSAAGLNVFSSEQDKLNEASAMYKDVLDQARAAGLDMHDVQVKLNAELATATEKLGGVTGSMPAFKQQLLSIIGLARSPEAQDLDKFLQGLEMPKPGAPLTGGAVGFGYARGLTTGNQASPYVSPAARGAAIPETNVPQLDQSRILHPKPEGVTVATPGGVQTLKDWQAQNNVVVAYLDHLQGAIDGGAKMSEVQDSIGAALRKGILSYDQVIRLNQQLGTVMPLRQAGAFQEILLSSNKLTDKQAVAFTKLVAPLSELGLTLPGLNEEFIKNALAEGDTRLAAETLAASLKGPVQQGIKLYADELTKAETKSIRAAIASGDLQGALDLLLQSVEHGKKKVNDYTGATDAMDRSMHGAASTVEKRTDAFYRLGTAVQHATKLNKGEKAALSSLQSVMQNNNVELTKNAAKHVIAAIKLGDYETAASILFRTIENGPKEHTTKFNSDTAPARAAVTDFFAWLNGLSVTVGVTGSVTAGGGATGTPRGGRTAPGVGSHGPANPKRTHFGGFIEGRGHGDRVPILAEPGEMVMNRMAVAQNRSRLESMNVERFKMGGMVARPKLDVSIDAASVKDAISKVAASMVPPAPPGGSGGWGGFRNGYIPTSAMTQVQPGKYLAPFAASAFMMMQSAYGSTIPITSAYRSYALQASMIPGHVGPIAPAGSSMHGWGEAVDIQTGIPAWNWMMSNAARYRWMNGSSFGDPPHFSYGTVADDGAVSIRPSLTQTNRRGLPEAHIPLASSRGIGMLSEALGKALSDVQPGGSSPTIIVKVLIDGEEVRGALRKRELLRGSA